MCLYKKRTKEVKVKKFKWRYIPYQRCKLSKDLELKCEGCRVKAKHGYYKLIDVETKALCAIIKEFYNGYTDSYNLTVFPFDPCLVASTFDSLETAKKFAEQHAKDQYEARSDVVITEEELAELNKVCKISNSKSESCTESLMYDKRFLLYEKDGDKPERVVFARRVAKSVALEFVANVMKSFNLNNRIIGSSVVLEGPIEGGEVLKLRYRLEESRDVLFSLHDFQDHKDLFTNVEDE